MKAYGTSYLFNAKQFGKNSKHWIFDKKTVFDATNFMSIFSQNLQYLWEYWTDLNKFSLEWKLMILGP